MNAPILQLHDLVAGYRNGQHTLSIVQSLNEALHEGELVCLIGPNGAGKSTLLRTIAGMQAPLAGRVDLLGKDLGDMSAYERARALSVVLTQKMDVGLLSAYEVVAMGRYPYTGWMGRLSNSDHECVRLAIAQVDASCLSERKFNTLSDGERQKILIARALAQEPGLMILDEPTAFLDLPRRVECMYLLRDLTRGTGRTILLSTHDLDLALRCADRIWLLPYGGHLQVGTPEDLVLNGGFQTAFSNHHVQFDIHTGAFITERPTTQSIVLEGEGVEHFWTQRALEREGFEVISTRGGELPIVRIDDTRVPSWWVHTPDAVHQCASINDLINTLRDYSNGQ